MNTAISNMPRLTVDTLNVVRGTNSLLENVSFSANAGDLIWISGSNGIGKTSLLKCLAGLLRPAGGDVRWDGEAPENAGTLLAFHGHKDGHKLNMTVEENLEFWQSVYGHKIEIDRVIDRLDLDQFLHLRAKDLSAGQSRRVALARLLLKNVPFWLLDEPGAPLDEDGRSLISELVSDHLANSGVAIIASHRPPSNLGANARHMILDRVYNE